MSRLSRGDLARSQSPLCHDCSLMTLNVTKVGFNILIKHIWENLNLTDGDSDDGAHCHPRYCSPCVSSF